MKRRSGKSNWPSGKGRDAGWKKSNEKRSAERKLLREHAFKQCCSRISEKTSLEVLQRRALRRYNKLQKLAAAKESIVACDDETPWTQPKYHDEKYSLGLSPGCAYDQDKNVKQPASPSTLGDKSGVLVSTDGDDETTHGLVSSDAESMPESFKCVFQVWKKYFWSISGSNYSAPPLLYEDPMAEFC